MSEEMALRLNPPAILRGFPDQFVEQGSLLMPYFCAVKALNQKSNCALSFI